jgi:predicted NBD/HSP70 family sugar kinase
VPQERTDTPNALRKLRETNAGRVLETLLGNPAGITQMDIASASGIARSTVSALMSKDLRGVTAFSEHGIGERGPPPRRWMIARDAAYSLGIDIGRSHLSVALADPYGEIVSGPYFQWCETRDDPDRVLAVAGEMVKQAVGSMVRCERIAAVAVGLPGVSDADSAWVVDLMAPAWTAFDIPKAVRQRWPLSEAPPVLVENDANLGALGELYRGAGKKVRSLLFIKWSTGIGSGIVLDGKLWRGKSGAAGELGHLMVHPTKADRSALRLPSRSEMETCPLCGQRDCLERVAGGEALARSLGVEDVRAVFRQMSDPDPVKKDAARTALNAAAKLIGTAIGPVLTMLNIERVIVGGMGGNDTYPLVVSSIRRGVDQTAPAQARTDAEIKPSVLGDRAYVTGAVIFGFREQGLNFLLRSADAEEADPPQGAALAP